MLYLVATPIGNMGDITYRAVEVLKKVDVIACEDTRHSLALLSRYEIKKQLISYHKFNERESGAKIIELLREGKNVAVISDAGMPVISDPGNVLVNMLIEADLPYTIIPGASASLSALVLSGINPTRFAFLGFLPEKKKDRAALLEKYKNSDLTLIFYSAPHDVKGDVLSLYEILGDRKAAAVREITKLYESVEHFSLKEGYPKEPKGEFVLIVEGANPKAEYENLTEKEHVELYLRQGIDKKEAIKRVAKERGVSKSSLYKYTIE